MSDTPTTAPEASTKRRALLKGAGVAAAAGGTPLVAMATDGRRLVTNVGKNGSPSIVCSLSGWQSFQNAQRTGQYKDGDFLSGTPSTNVCGGYSPGWWGQKNRDGSPKRWTGGMAGLANMPYTTALPGGALQVNGVTATMWQVMDRSEFSSSNDRHWLGAWLNARSNEVQYEFNANDNFPFTSQQITSFYMENNAEALALIKTYLELHN